MLKKLITTFISVLACSTLGLALQARAQDHVTPLTFIVVIDRSASMDDRFPAPVQPVLSDSTKLMDVKRRLSLLVDQLPDNTRVLVTAFDHEAHQLCDVRLDSVTARKQLQQTFAAIKGRGGATFLWRTADAELERAKKLVAANPENRVRLLLYTDGNDSEHAPGLDHTTIITKYGPSLQSAVRLDWITIGFDVQTEIKRALQATGVTFTRADTPRDIDPLVAGFNLSKKEVALGAEVRLIDQSVGIDITQNWVNWGDGSKSEQGSSLRHHYAAPGEYLVRYIVINANGRRHEASRYIKVVRPIAPIASFVLPTSRVHVGDALTLINESTNAERYEWQLNDRLVSTERQPTITFGDYGVHRIKLVVWDKLNQSSRKEVAVEIPRPAAPIASFELPQSATVGQELTLISTSTGVIDGPPRWTVDGRPLESERLVKWTAQEPGKHRISLSISGPGGGHTAERELVVNSVQPPKASFTIGDESPLVGDRIKIVDTSTGPISIVRFEVHGLGTPIYHELRDRNQSWFELPCVTATEVTIKQHVIGPGGEDHASNSVRIGSRAMVPKADFAIQQSHAVGKSEVRFSNRSQGSIDHFEFDPGDGSPVRTFATATDFVHTYSVGTWFPKITAHPARNEQLSPSKWAGTKIEVLAPMPAWKRNLLWQIPCALLVPIVGLIGILRIRESRIRQHQKRIGGHLSVYRSGKPRSSQPFDFSGQRCEETVQLDSSTSLKLSSPVDGRGSLQVQLLRDGLTTETKEIDENGHARLGDYIIDYTA